MTNGNITIMKAFTVRIDKLNASSGFGLCHTEKSKRRISTFRTQIFGASSGENRMKQI